MKETTKHRRRFHTGILCSVTLLVLCATRFASAAINDGLVAWYPMDGNANDASGNNANGQNLTGAVQYAPGRVGLAGWFDGQSTILLPQPRLLDGAANASISAWIDFSAFVGGQIIATGDNRSGLDPISTRINPGASEDLTFAQVENGSGIGFFQGGKLLSGLSVGQWHLFTLVLERQAAQSVLSCYVDANLVAQETSTTFSHIAYDRDMLPLIGGIEEASPYQFWHGGIDDLRIYNRALSGAEVKQLAGVPEPSTLALVAVGGLALLMSQKRRKAI
jgi:Concanavalin A-like lectin/glucanases superfamily/PEP-CTERM motif